MVVSTASKEEDWEWIVYRKTNWKRPDGEQMFIALLRCLTPVKEASNQPPKYQLVKVFFWAKRPKPLLNSACAKRRSRAELIRFFQAQQS